MSEEASVRQLQAVAAENYANNNVDLLSPEAAADLGFTAPEEVEEVVRRAANVARAALPTVIDDPELNAAYHEQRAAAEQTRTTRHDSGPRVSAAEAMKNERRHIAKTRRQYPRSRRVY